MTTWIEAAVVVIIMMVSIIGGPVVIGSVFLVVLTIGGAYQWLLRCKRTKTGFWEE